MEIRFTLATATVFFLLWGAFFIELQVPLIIGLMMAVYSIGLALLGKLRMDKIGILLFANIAYWLISGFLVGAITPLDLVNMKLYNGDGRIFISLVPLLLLTVIGITEGDFRRIIKILLVIAVSSLAIYITWLGTHTTYLSGPGHADEFHGFLTSHTGSGTFFGAIATFTLIYGYEKRSWRITLLGIALLGPMYSSGSREALLAVMIMMAWYFVIRRPSPGIVLGGTLAFMLMVAIAPSVMSNKDYNRTFGLLSWNFVESMVNQAERGLRSDWQTGDWSPAGDDEENLESGDVTTLVRIQLWTYAAKRFFDSPLFGMGWGRFNDRNVILVDMPGVLTFAPGGTQTLSTSNAHNSYFHLASESGLIGLVMYISVWVWMYIRVHRGSKILHSFRNTRAYLVACEGLIVYALACALTGHALASPSVMIPVLCIVGTGIAYLRTVLRPAQMKADSSIAA